MKAVEFIIRAKDVTQEACRKAVGNVKELAEKVKESVAGGTSRAADSFSNMADKAIQSISQIMAKVPGISGGFSKAFASIAQMGGGVGAALAAAVTAWAVAIKRIVDSIVEKWREAAKAVADNWQRTAESMTSSFERVGERIDKATESMKRRQAGNAKTQSALFEREHAKTDLSREREVQTMLANGASAEDVQAKRDQWQNEDKLRSIKEREVVIANELDDIEERRIKREQDMAALKENVVYPAERKLLEANETIAKMSARAREADRSGFSARASRIREEVNGILAGTDAVTKAAYRGIKSAYQREDKMKAEAEADDNRVYVLNSQKAALEAERETLRLAQQNADALKEQASAKKDAEEAAKEAARAEAEAARDAERRAAQEKAAQQELAMLAVDIDKARFDSERDGGSKVARQRVQLLEEYYAKLEAAADESERQEIRADQRVQAARLNLLKQFEDEERKGEVERARLEAANKAAQHRQDVADAQDALSKSQMEERGAQSRLAAAKSMVAQAWGWYRDKDSMQAHIDDVVAQREAEKQWEKDFDKLKRKRGWRDIEVGKLSAEEEATRQVALAKEEEQAAQKALDEIAENTRDLAKKLDELMTMREE